MMWLAWIASGCPVPAVAQTSPLPFCYQKQSGGQQCFDTLELAEQAMRAAPENAAIASLLEPDLPTLFPLQGTAEYVYRVKDQTAPSVFGPSYIEQNSSNGIVSGMHGCTPGNDPNLPTACLDEQQLVANVAQELRTARPDCSHSGPVFAVERVPPYKEVRHRNNVVFGSTYGEVDYGSRLYNATRVCNGVSTVFDIRIFKLETFSCPSGYTRLGDLIPNDGNGDLTPHALCRYNGAARRITGPVRQVASCRASRYPCYPATGDKAREEPDFAFAGRTFTRYYHSLHQFRSNIGFAIGWTHTFSDRVHGTAGSTPVAIVDGTGYYESFVRLATGRYRGENSTDKTLEYIASGTVRWRLRLPGGEVREFDISGRLLRVSNPADPLHDVALEYANELLSTATDGQGRKLRFRYDAAKRLMGIDLPDGTAIGYAYDAERNLVRVDSPDGHARHYHYAEPGLVGDASQRHHLTGITAETGERFASFRYDAMGRVIESRAFGPPDDVTTVSYDSDTQATVTTASGEQRIYSIQPGLYRRITGVRTAGEVTEDRQSFDAEGRLQRRTDRLDVHTDYEYHATDAYLSAVTEAVGRPEQRRTEIVRDPAGNRVLERRVRDAAGALKAQTNWHYNGRGQLASTILNDPSTGVTRTSMSTYCEQADVDAGSCPRVGLLVAADGPRADAADIVSYQYRMADHPDCAASPATCAWRKGDPWKTTNALGQTVEILAHDGAGRVRSIRDANGVITEIEYDPRGRPTATKLRGVDAGSESDDRIARIEYWPDGAVKKTIQPDGAFLLFDYDDARRLTTIVDNDGNAIVYTLNASGERTKEEVLDATGTLRRTLARSYNALGQLIAIRDARAQTSNGSGGYLYPATMSYTYDPEGRLDLATDALGRQTDHDYDALGRLTRSLQNATAVTTAPDRAEIISEYDALDRTTRIIDPNGLQTTYGYNVFGDLQQQTSPDTGLTTSSHDSAGNPTQTTDADGRQRTRAYDALGRVTAVSYPQDTTLNETYVYDTAQSDCTADESFLVGRLSRMTDGSGSTTYCYNRFGDLTRKVQRTQGKTFVLQWQYAVNGRLLGMTLPSGALLDYSHDAQGRVAEIGATTEGQRTQVVSNTSYHPFAGPARWQSANGRVVVRTQNQNGQPGVVQAQDQAGAAIDGISLGYEFDAVGNLKRLRNGHQAEPPTRIYDHDALNRLIEARDAANAVWQSYSYDKTGNRQTAGWRTVQMNQDCSASGDNCTPLPPTTQWHSESYTRYTASHRLFTKGQRLRSYDNAGNLTLDAPNEAIPIDPPPGGETESAAYEGTLQSVASDGGESSPSNGDPTRSFSYSAANRMSGTSLAGELRMSYRYNGAGERVYRQGGGKTVHTVFDPSGRWLGDYDANGLLIQEAIWLGDLPVGLLTRVAGDVRLFHIEPDALGTPRVVVDPTRGATGTVVWRWDLASEAFGKDKPNEDPDNDGTAFVLDMRYPGQQYDSATGFNYNYFRDYDAATGRYVESDPIGLAGGIATYAYGNNAPPVFSDPSGLHAIGAPSIGGYGGSILGGSGASIGATPVAAAPAGAIAGTVGIGAAIGIAGGIAFNYGWDYLFDKPFGTSFYDWTHPESYSPVVASESAEEIVNRLNQREDGSAVTIPWPPRQKGKYICICRANNLARSAGCASFGYGFGIGDTAREARNKAEGMAQAFAGGVDQHHTQCKCRDPKGQTFNY